MTFEKETASDGFLYHSFFFLSNTQKFGGNEFNIHRFSIENKIPYIYICGLTD